MPFKVDSCFVMNAYCGIDKTVFQNQLKEAMLALGDEILHALPKNKTQSGDWGQEFKSLDFPKITPSLKLNQ